MRASAGLAPAQAQQLGHERLERGLRLEPRQRGAEAEVLAEAEADVALRVARRRRSGRDPGSAARRGSPSRAAAPRSRRPGCARPRSPRPRCASRNTSWTGESKRTASSIRLGTRLGSAATRASCSGWSSSAAVAFPIRFVVVSLPATSSSVTNCTSSIGERPAPSFDRDELADQVVGRLLAPHARDADDVRRHLGERVRMAGSNGSARPAPVALSITCPTSA